MTNITDNQIVCELLSLAGQPADDFQNDKREQDKDAKLDREALDLFDKCLAEAGYGEKPKQMRYKLAETPKLSKPRTFEQACMMLADNDRSKLKKFYYADDLKLMNIPKTALYITDGHPTAFQI